MPRKGLNTVSTIQRFTGTFREVQAGDQVIVDHNTVTVASIRRSTIEGKMFLTPEGGKGFTVAASRPVHITRTVNTGPSAVAA